LKFAFIIFKYFPYGGMQRDMLRIARELIKQGHRIEVFAISWEGEQNEPGLTVTILPAPGWFNFKRYQNFLVSTKAYIDKLKGTDQAFDYVLGFNRATWLDAYFGADPCFIERAHVQRSFLYRLTPRFRWFAQCEKAIFHKDSRTHVLLLSKKEKLDFQKWYQTPDQRFHYIPPFLSRERFELGEKSEMRTYLREAFGFKPNDFVFLLVGSGFFMKGLDRAIRAIAALPEAQKHKVKLVAVGQDKPEPMLKIAKKLGVLENVVISKGRPDIPKLMQGADVYIHPAYRENTGLVLLEALACGLPALVTETCGYAHHIRDANAGLIVTSPYQQENLNQLLECMLLSQDLEKFSKNGIRYVQKIMSDNDGSAEANVLIDLAQKKNTHHA
jgi:UDP-glucose:(heptosyl)LPS alpha-1,3-glucosyltransferase